MTHGKLSDNGKLRRPNNSRGNKMEFKFDINGTESTIELDKSKDSLVTVCDGKEVSVDLISAGSNLALLNIDGRNYPVHFSRNETGLHLMISGHSFLIKDPSESGATKGSGDAEIVDGKQILVAPMPGQVVKVNVKQGDSVIKKQCLVIVEAMKMENELNTAIDGIVTGVYVGPGQQVDAMAPLVEVTQADSSKNN